MDKSGRRKPLTQLAVDRLRPPTDRERVEVWDGALPGFGLRITRSGAKVFQIMTRIHGKAARFSLGRHSEMTLVQAREAARAKLRAISEGGDPKADERAAALELERQREAKAKNTFETVMADWLKRDQASNRSLREVERIVQAEFLPRWRGRDVAEVTRRDVLDLLDAKVDAGAVTMANRVLAHLRRFFNWCIERGIMERSPCAGLPAPGREVKRDRVLTDDELRLVWMASAEVGWPFRDIVRILIMTGQRRDEVGGMAWPEVDLDRAEWTIPAERSKNGKAHVVPLAPAVVGLLKAAPRGKEGEYVFSMDGAKPFNGYSKAKVRLDAAVAALAGTQEEPAPLPEWRLHDLRRTAASGMAALGVQPVVIEKVLNHVNAAGSALAAVYNRHTYGGEMRRALEGWAVHVASLMFPRPKGTVVPLRTIKR